MNKVLQTPVVMAAKADTAIPRPLKATSWPAVSKLQKLMPVLLDHSLIQLLGHIAASVAVAVESTSVSNTPPLILALDDAETGETYPMAAAVEDETEGESTTAGLEARRQTTAW